MSNGRVGFLQDGVASFYPGARVYRGVHFSNMGPAVSYLERTTWSIKVPSAAVSRVWGRMRWV